MHRTDFQESFIEPYENNKNNCFVYEKINSNKILRRKYSAELLNYEKHNRNESYLSYLNCSEEDVNNKIFHYDNERNEINTEKIAQNLSAISRILEIFQSLPFPRLSFTTTCISFIIAIFFSPRPFVKNIIFPTFRLSFGTLYPAYASYKAVRTKNVKEYVSSQNDYYFQLIFYQIIFR